MSDGDIIDVIAEFIAAEVGYRNEYMDGQAADMLAALRAAGFDVAPADTIRLGRAVEACWIASTDEGGDDRVLLDMPDAIHSTKCADELLYMLYERAGIERGGE